jgi:hypothetical protein
VTRNDTPQSPGGPPVNVTVERTMQDEAFYRRIVAVKLEPTPTRNRFRLSAFRMVNGGGMLPIGYLCTDSGGDVVIMPTAGGGAEYLWSLGAKQGAPMNQWTLWNAHADDAHRDWRHPTAVVDVRQEGAATVLTTRVLETADTAEVMWSFEK